MSIWCRIGGHSFVPTDKETEEGYEMRCDDGNCKKTEYWNGDKVCEEHDCLEYVIGINYYHDTKTNGRNYSQRCYRCPRCGSTWHDDNNDMLDGKDWYVRDGKAVHRAELDELFTKIDTKKWDEIKNAKTIREVRKIIEEL